MCLPLNVKAAYDATINENSVRIRRKAGTNYSILYTVNKGTEISVVDKTLHSGTGCSKKWYKMSAINIANAGYFSADRAVSQYAKDIWNL